MKAPIAIRFWQSYDHSWGYCFQQRGPGRFDGLIDHHRAEGFLSFEEAAAHAVAQKKVIEQQPACLPHALAA